MVKGFLNRDLISFRFKRRIVFGKKYIPLFRIKWFGLWHLWDGGAAPTTLCGIKRPKPLRDTAKVWPLKLNRCSKCHAELARKTWK
ncbi:MAG: hypothetical protein ACXAC5_04315 [Promethearchaeota archaeon]|jgi:hypothetical protein